MPVNHFKLDMRRMEREDACSELLSACGSLDQKTVFTLVDSRGAEIVAEAADSVGQNCVHYVACSAEHDSERQVALLQYLAQHGADVNKARATDGWTPVFLAVVFGLAPIVQALLALGAKTAGIKDSDGMTAEEWAGKYCLKHIKDLLVHK